MNELQGLLTPTRGNKCTVLDSAISCPNYEVIADSWITCGDCVFNTTRSKVHPKLIELIPILLID